DGPEQARQVGGVVRAVGVHLDDGAVAAPGGPLERGEVGRAQAPFLGAVEDVDAPVVRGERVGEVPGAVGRVVVDDEHVRLGARAAGGGDGVLEVVALVVGGYGDERRAGLGGACPVRCGARGGAFSAGHCSPGESAAVSARRCRRLRVTAAARAASAAAVRIASGRIPARVAGVASADRVSSFWITAAVLNSVACETAPVWSVKAEMPTVEAMRPSRPCSMERSRTIASCWPASLWSKVALLVWTASSSAPSRTESAVSPSKAISKQIRPARVMSSTGTMPGSSPASKPATESMPSAMRGSIQPATVRKKPL